ncbi:uncharacterized protein LOC124167727 [Ischnura elegans]|uniref:uncharacterized protein LOC124167727 n=1 Tax=Ischnura elegans TaxID=197161 RepID=UPI001ED87554|nr:uncharacterized protein LOC124167727 [Ischnura elegans]
MPPQEERMRSARREVSSSRAAGGNNKDLLSASARLKDLLEYGPKVPATGAGSGGSGPQGSNTIELPPWFDWDKFQRGQRYFQHNFFTMFAAKLCGLLAILAIPTILRVLSLTKQSGTPSTAFKRYLSTLDHMLSWYEGDLLEPTSKAYQSLAAVRGKHDAAARKALKMSSSSVPLSQLDMVLTQFAFMGLAILCPNKLGISPTSSSSREADEEGFIHFWRTIAYLLGVQDRFNICRPSTMETKAICRGLLVNVLVPSLRSPPPAFGKMARALTNGMWALVPVLDAHAFLRYTRSLMGDKMKDEDTKPYTMGKDNADQVQGFGGPYSRFIFNLVRFVQETLLGIRIINAFLRPYLNIQLKFAIFLAHKFPFLTITHTY